MKLGSTESNIHSNLLFVLADIMETCLLDTKELLAKDGFELRHEAKREFNNAMSSIRKLKFNIGKCAEDTQNNFGNDSDMLYETMKLIIDRCGANDYKLFELYNYIKAQKSDLNMKQLDSTVFSHVISK